jgi:polyisoprenoid-binding protein YceI
VAPFALVLISAGPVSGQWSLELEPNHSSISFAVPVAGGITKVRGVFRSFVVKITYDENEITQSKVVVNIEATSVDTNNEMRDHDLRGETFFDVARHPLITFESRRIDRRGEGYVAVGDLVIKGIKRTVEVPFVITRIDHVPERGPVLGASSAWSVNRKDFDLGIDWRHSAIPNFLGDVVTVEVDLWTRTGKRTLN